MSKKYIFLINSIIFLIGAVIATLTVNKNPGINMNWAITFFAGLICTIAFIIVNQIKIKLDFLTVALFTAFMAIIGSFIFKYDQGFLTGFVLFIFTGLIYSLKTNAYSSNFITRYFIGSFTYFYLKLKAFGGYIGETNAKNNIKGFRFESKDFILTFILFIVFGAPLVLIVLGLLASVNPNFANFISWEFVSRIIFGSIVFVYLASELYLLKVIPKDKKLLQSPKVKFDLDNSKTLLRVVLLVLILLNLFYVFFIGADLGGEINNTQDHFKSTEFRSYSDYSTSRFWALIQVSIINLFLVYLITKPLKVLTKENSKFLRPAIITNLVLMIILSLGLIFSTLARLNLYISGYGLTEDRLYGVTFTILLGIILILFSLGVYAKKHNKYQLTAFALTILYFAFMHLLPMGYITNKISYELYKVDAIKVFNAGDILYSSYLSFEPGGKNEKRVCFDQGRSTHSAYEKSFQISNSEKYLVAIDIVKENNSKIPKQELDCMKRMLKEVSENTEDTTHPMYKSWTYMEQLSRNQLEENKNYFK